MCVCVCVCMCVCVYIYIYNTMMHVKYYSTYTNNIFIHNVHIGRTRYRIVRSINDHR